jgi:hypothetical protein
MFVGSGDTIPAATDTYGEWKQHQQLLMPMGSENTTPAAVDAYGN